MNTGTCPLCGGTIGIAGHMSGVTHGFVYYSLCCGVSADLLANWEVIEPLPPALREIAVRQDRGARDARERQEAEALARYVEARKSYVDPLPDRLSKVVNPEAKGSPFAI